ncbi:hypothetical protein FIBSPDRAFT_899803 [Athelia psychrophila]|uniref:Ribonuclease H1 N-terminal domain-containing protein n=1 Tax=Athelia psychrophila TaxID=1759441 RepID=A0A165ZAI9_9AGAM|nr:hypothetical protein FIBSPDRAFT_899803 [Fibularhizoctonia sp. CBS 109695]
MRRLAPTVAQRSTNDELLREAEFCSRDASLRAREAVLMYKEADLLSREARLRRREERQDEAEQLAFTGGDNSAFWESLEDAPSDDECEIAASISSTGTESDITTSTLNTPAPLTPPPREHRATPLARGLPHTPERVNPRDTRVYQVASPGIRGVAETWATAGHYTLPRPGAHAKLVSTLPRTHHAPFKYFAIVKGTYPGVYEGHWFDYEMLVRKVPHANYKGFQKLDEAKAAFLAAYVLGLVVAIPARDSDNLGPRPPTASIVSTPPSEDDVLAALSSTSQTSPESAWYVVFKGIRPGIYQSWNFVSDLVRGVSTATYQRFESHDAAKAAFRHAERNGEVQVLRTGQSYVIATP